MVQEAMKIFAKNSIPFCSWQLSQAGFEDWGDFCSLVVPSRLRFYWLTDSWPGSRRNSDP